MPFIPLMTLCLASWCLACPNDSGDILIADFEGATYGSWKTTGTAFGTGPAHGTLPNQMVVDGFKGKGLVNTYLGGDASTGTLTSPPFRVQRKYFSFLIGGGKDPERLALNLLVDGRIVRSATGPNDKPGGSERLAPAHWDVSDLKGQGAVIQIVDQATGGWGHINVDEIVQTDQLPPEPRKNVTWRMPLTHRYLNLPIKNGGPKRQMSIAIDGEDTLSFEIELADDKPDWWAFVDVSSFKGREATLLVDTVPVGSKAVSSIFQADSIVGAKELYREPLRPQFHFSPRRGWTNDPNGLVYANGEYHLFFQHNPYGWGWGNMHWGHAVSPDLLHWTELPEALFPDRLGTMFSGSAVVDAMNSAHFQTGTEKPIVCMFTAAGQPFTQGLAFSNDRGRTWKKFDGNPVLGNLAEGNRDPDVSWYEPQHKWIMALYLEGSEFGIFDSKDLKTWRRLSSVTIPGTSECPNFFEMPVQGEPGKSKWVLYGGNGGYLVGSFDGDRFTPEPKPQSLQQGNCWYASQTFNGIPASDGRRILIPWGQIDLPGMPFNQMMGLPVELTLARSDHGFTIQAKPIRELKSLRKKTQILPASTLEEGADPLSAIGGELVDLEVDVAPGTARQIAWNLRGVSVVYDVASQTLKCLDRSAKLNLSNGHFRLRALVDRASIDIFAGDGQVYMPMGKVLDPSNRSLSLRSIGGTARIESLTVSELNSVWKR